MKALSNYNLLPHIFIGAQLNISFSFQGLFEREFIIN